MKNPVKQRDYSELLPYQYKKGQSGNPLGRYKGATSGKERAKQYLASLTDDEWEEFLHGLSKIDIWRMAEGMPESKTEHSGKLEVVNSVAELSNEELERLLNLRSEAGTSQERTSKA